MAYFLETWWSGLYQVGGGENPVVRGLGFSEEIVNGRVYKGLDLKYLFRETAA